MEQTTLDNSVSLRSVIRVLFKRKRIIILFFLSVVATVTIGTFQMRPIYRAESTIMINWEKETEKTLILEMNALLRRSDYDRIAAEIQILKSRPIAEFVTEELGLAAGSDPIAGHYKAVAEVQNALKVEQTKGTNVLEVAYSDIEAKRAADILNCLIKNYIKYRAELAKDFRAYEFFEDQIENTASKLNELENRQAEFKSKYGVMASKEEADILLTKLSDYESTLTEVRTRRIGKEAKLEVIRENLAASGEVTIPSTETSDSPSREEYITKLKTSILGLELERNKLLQKYTARHPQVVSLENEIELAQAKLRKELLNILSEEDTNIQALRAEERVLESKIAQVKIELGELAKNASELNKISRGIEENQQVYAKLFDHREEARIALSKQDQIVQVKVISAALPPAAPVKPNKVLYIGLAFVFGLIAALGSAFLVEYFDHSIETNEDVERKLGFPVLASIRQAQIINYGKRPLRKGLS